MKILIQTAHSFLPTWKKLHLYKLYVVFVVAAVCYQCVQGVLLIDSVEYLNAAKNLGQFKNWDCCFQGNLCDVLFHETRRTPGYPAYLLFTGLGAVSRLLQVIPAVLAPLLTLRVLSHFKAHSSASRFIIFLFLFYPLQFFYTTLIMPEIWVQFLLLWLAICLLEKKYTGSIINAAILPLFKPVFLPFLFLSFLLFFALKNRQKVILLLPACCYLFVCIFNKMQTGAFHFTSIATANAWDYNARAVSNKQLGVENTNLLFAQQDSMVRGMSFAAGMKFLSSKTQNIIATHFLTYTLLHIRGSLITLVDPGRYDFVAWWQLPEGKGLMGIKGGQGLTAFFDQPPLYLAYIIFFFILSLLKLLLAIRALIFNLKYQQVWILLGLLFIPLALVGPVGSARYLMPVAPILFVFCALGLQKAKFSINENTAHQR